MTIYEITAAVYAAFLACGAFMVWKQTRAMKRTLFTLIGNYALAFAYTWFTRDADPWLVFMGLDFVSGLIVLMRPAATGQAIVGLIYLMMIITHAVYALRLPNVDGFVYWWLLTILAFAQVAVVGGWMLHDRGYRLPAFLRRIARPLPAHRTGAKG